MQYKAHQMDMAGHIVSSKVDEFTEFQSEKLYIHSFSLIIMFLLISKAGFQRLDSPLLYHRLDTLHRRTEWKVERLAACTCYQPDVVPSVVQPGDGCGHGDVDSPECTCRQF